MSLNLNDSNIFPRRNFIKMSLLISLALSIPKKSEAILKRFLPKSLMEMSPIQAVGLSQFNSLDFNGDNIERPHDILWNLDGYIAKKGGLPKPTEKRKVVVVGGGMAGLISAYQLRDYDPLILEQDKNFGGNSKGETYQNATYSIGAAYIVIPDEGDPIDLFLRDIGIRDELKLEGSDEARFTYKKKMISDFWKGASDPERSEEFIKVEAELRRIYNDAYPDIPWTSSSAISFDDYLELDSISFEGWLELKFGKIHPHIAEYFQLYCWSSFNGSINELSALQVLNFVTSEVDGVLALPGGNAAITQRLMEKISEATSPDSVRAQAFVVKVEKKPNGLIWVSYEDGKGVMKTIETEFCVVASPKFVAKLIVPDLPLDQIKLMDDIKYRGYIVGNAIFNHPVKSPSFDVFCFEGEVPEAPMAMKQSKRAFSDVCFGTWAADDQTQNGVLTVYRALPYDGGRQFLFSPLAHEKHKKIILDDLKNFAHALGVDFSDLKGVRMTRWGHSLPVANTGLIKSGFLENMSRPFGGKIFFANQDNWANPAFECSFAAAKEATDKIRELIK